MRFSRSLFFVAVFLAALGSAQNAPIHGTIVDPNRAEIPRASVRLLSGSNEVAHALTDQQGKFSFSEACSESCSVEIQLPGFETRNVPVPLADAEIKLDLAPVQEHVNVTANLTETPTEQVGSSVTTIDAKEISDRQSLMVSDYLRTVPGVSINRSGGVGELSSLFIRGGESDYTKVLVDGIPINEPGGTQDFSGISADNLRRIEIVRGPQSALFGTDAMTGVVQIFTEHGSSEDERPHVRLDFEGGKYNTFQGGVGAGGQYKNFDYDGYWSRMDSDNQGPDAAFRDSTGGFNLGLTLGKTEIRWIGRGTSSNAGTPGQTAFGPPDTGSFINKGEGYSGLSLKNQTASNWSQRLTYTYARSRQVSRDDIVDPPFTPVFDGITAAFDSFDFLSNFVNDTRRQHLDYESDVTLGSGDRAYGQHIVTFAFGWDRETGLIGDDESGFASTHARRDNFGGTFQDQMVLGRFVISNGVRVEDNGSFGKVVVPRSSAAFLARRGSGTFGATKLKFNFGLGIKEPSFIESFSPEVAFRGNPNLRPERSRSFDFGVEQRLWSDHAKVEFNWFDNRFRDLVQFEFLGVDPNTGAFLGTYENVNRTKANGAELIIEAAPIPGVTVTANYTYLNSHIVQSDNPGDIGTTLLRRPRHSGSLAVVWDWRKLTFSSTAGYVGRRADNDFVGLGLTSSSPYSKWDIVLAYRINRQLSFTSAFENVLDRSYMEALGFPALRATYRTGLRVRF
jgi:vitamin B12 transporter